MADTYSTEPPKSALAKACQYTINRWQAVPRQYSVRLEPLTIPPRVGNLPGSMLRLLVALLPTLFSTMRS
jgi:hypothetical protein